MALARGAWAEARVRFAEALEQEETPEALEGAGLGARYELDAEAALEAHERGYRLARSRGDAASAARLAIQLSYDAYAFRGRPRPRAGLSAPRCSLRGRRRMLRPRGCQ